MTNVKVVINDNVEFDGSTDDWVMKPPDLFRDMVKPNATPKPWMKAIMVEFADAVMQKRNTEIDVTTRSYGWGMSVKYE